MRPYKTLLILLIIFAININLISTKFLERNENTKNENETICTISEDDEFALLKAIQLLNEKGKVIGITYARTYTTQGDVQSDAGTVSVNTPCSILNLAHLKKALYGQFFEKSVF